MCQAPKQFTIVPVPGTTTGGGSGHRNRGTGTARRRGERLHAVLNLKL